jgi:predicted ATPase
MRDANGRPFHFTHLSLRNWRNFTAAEMDLAGRAFLVGPNASGKSNLLDVFRFLRDLSSVGGGFQSAVDVRGGVSSLRSLSARRYSDVEIKVALGNEAGPKAWQYELSFNQDNQRRPVIRNERVVKGGTNVLCRPDDKDNADPARLTQTHLEQVYANKEFRDVAEFFATVRYYHLVPQLIREPDRSTGHSNDPFGGDFLEQVAGTGERTRNARLRRMREALRVVVPKLQELELYKDARGTPHLRGRYENWRPHGAWQTEERFSDGTLRLLGLLWSAQCGSGPLLLEEPELSLHPEAVRYIPQMFARLHRKTGRQIVVSTHSPELLKDVGIGLDEVFLLRPGANGTTVTSAGSLAEIRELLDNGSSLADAVMPHTRPDNVHQLALFPDFG